MASSGTLCFSLCDVARMKQHFTALVPVCQTFEPEPQPLLPAPDLSQLEVCDEKSCATCGAAFETRLEQVQHFRGDWHRFNVKAKLSGAPIVSEADFEQLGSDCESISASDSEDSGGESDHLKELQVVYDTAKLLFMNAEGHVLEINRSLVRTKNENLTTSEMMGRVEALKDLRLALIVISGGHFAAAVYRDGRVVQHKTFHHYTVRKGQGGSQSQHDSKSGPAKSAGANLRRHQEKMLVEKARQVLKSWPELDRCSTILYRALGAGNRSVLFEGNDPVFRKDDLRLRTIPMMTRRPTLKELDRIYAALTTVKVVFDPSAYYETREVVLDMVKKTESSKGRAGSQKTTHRRTKDIEPKPERVQPPKTERVPGSAAVSKQELLDELFGFVRDDDLEGVEGVVAKTDEETFRTLLTSPLDEDGQTLMHFCCRRSRASLLEKFLELGGDATVPNRNKQTPYEVATADAIREVMIAFRSTHPTRFDYDKAKIPEKLVKAVREVRKKPKLGPSDAGESAKGDLLKRLTDTMRSCDFCKKEFRTVPLEADGKRFCSVNCVRAWRFS